MQSWAHLLCPFFLCRRCKQSSLFAAHQDPLSVKANLTDKLPKNVFTIFPFVPKIVE